MKSACPPQRRGCIARKRRADPLCARSPSPGAANALHFVLHTHLKIRYFYKNIFRKVSYMIPKNRADIRKNKESLIFNGSLFGLGERIRTSGLLNPIQARYQAALHPDAGSSPMHIYFMHFPLFCQALSARSSPKCLDFRLRIRFSGISSFLPVSGFFSSANVVYCYKSFLQEDA